MSRKNDPVVDAIEGFTFPDDLHTSVGSVHSSDVVKPVRSRRQIPYKTYKYVLGDVYRLCLAGSLDEACRKFGAVDTIRVSLNATDSQLAYSLFDNHIILFSDYDGSVILEFSFK